MLRERGWAILATALLIGSLAVGSTARGAGPLVPTLADGAEVWTVDAEFDQGDMVGVNHEAVADQLQLNVEQSTFPFIWIADSGEGTISKLDTRTGAELGRYRTAPDGTGANPSRTTVDLDGNVWVGNRDSNTITKVGLLEAGNCVDRNGNGVIDTSAGSAVYGGWPAFSPPADECVLLHVVLNRGGSAVRGVAIDAQNNVYAGMSAGDNIYYVDGATGAIIRDFHNKGYTSYGAVVDPEGNLWVSGFMSGQYLIKHDFTATAPTVIFLPHQPYGIAVDADGYIWASGWYANVVSKIRRSDGVRVASYPLPGGCHRGVAITSDGDVWVANSCGNSVTRLTSAGTIVAVIPVGQHPTGVAVDESGKVWATNLNSNNASRIDPATNTVDGTFAVGRSPYNYSDMTGMVVRNFTTRTGTWTVVHDSGTPGMRFGKLTWTSDEPAGTAVSARVRAAETEAGLGGALWVDAANGVRFDVAGRFIQIEMKLTTVTNGVTPVLYDVALEPANQAPTANPGGPYTGVEGSAVAFDGSNSTDPDGDALDFAWEFGDGATGAGVGVAHTYADDGAYDVTLKVTDPQGASDQAATTATILNLAPVVEAGPDVTLVSGQALDLAGTFTDAGILDSHTALVDWGDGSSESLPVDELGGAGTAKGAHPYLTPGAYTVTLTVTDDDGAVGTDRVQVEVGYVGCYGLDIKGHNGLNPGNKGEVPVVLQGTEGCPVADVDWTTVRFGPAEAAPVREPQYADHSEDGIVDVMFHFLMPETGIQAGDTEACMVGGLTDGRFFRSCQAIRTTPPKR